MIYFLWRHDGLWEWRHFTQPKENQKSHLTPNAHGLGILCNAVLRNHSVEKQRLSWEGILNLNFLNGFPSIFVVYYQNCKINTLRKNSNSLCSWHLMRSSGHSHMVPLSFFLFWLSVWGQDSTCCSSLGCRQEEYLSKVVHLSSSLIRSSYSQNLSQESRERVKPVYKDSSPNNVKYDGEIIPYHLSTWWERLLKRCFFWYTFQYHTSIFCCGRKWKWGRKLPMWYSWPSEDQNIGEMKQGRTLPGMIGDQYNQGAQALPSASSCFVSFPAHSLRAFSKNKTPKPKRRSSPLGEPTAVSCSSSPLLPAAAVRSGPEPQIRLTAVCECHSLGRQV